MYAPPVNPFVHLAAAMATLGGPLIAAGGGETSPGMVRAFLRAIGGPDRTVVVLALTREDPKASGPASVELLREHGATRVLLIDEADPAPGDLATWEGWIGEARGVWIPGGDQNLVIERLPAAWRERVLCGAHRRGVAFFGTSAGAMLLSDPMIAGNGDELGTANTNAGLGLTRFLIDTHYRERSRQARLRHAIAATGAGRAIGLDSGEWVVIWGDRIVRRHGRPEVIEPSPR